MTHAETAQRPQNICLTLLLLALWLVPGTTLADLRIAVISDLNSSYGTIGHHRQVGKAIDRIIELHPDIVISTGDMIAGQRRDPLPREHLEAMWEAFHEAVSEPLARAGIPFAITPGNHDASAYDAFARERSLFARVWVDRTTGLDFVDKDRFPFTYAIAVGDTLLISLDVTTAGSLIGKDRAWLEALLERTRDRYRHRVVFSHLPIWPVAEDRIRGATEDGELHSLLARAGVDLYLSGHHHAFYPGTVDGITYVSQACLGSGPRRLIGSSSGREPQAFTLIEIGDDRIRVGALVAPDYRELLDWGSLPETIASEAITLRRTDLVDVAVSPLDSTRIAARNRTGNAHE